MNCPKCGKELTEQDGIYLCAGCGARFRKKQPQPAATTPAESSPATKREEAPATQSDAAQTPPTAPVEAQAQAEPGFSAPAEEQTSTPPTETAEAPAEGATIDAPQTEEQRRIAELERRLAEMESRQNAPAPKGSGEKGAFFKKAVSWVKGHKKAAIIAAVAVVLILAVMIPLLVTFCGVRGVYVNVKDQSEYYRFGVSSVEYCENVDDPEMMMEGKYNISGNSITFTIEDEMFGEMSDTSSFQKLDGNKKIQIGDDVYEYVGYSIGGTVTLTFDANGGIGSTEVEVEMSKRIASMPENPTKSGYNFGGWKVSSDRYFSEYDPVWKDMILIADWKECNHSTMSCDESRCETCGKAKQDMSKSEILGLTHTLDETCACTKCGTVKHNYNSDSVCSRCGTSAVAVSGTTLTKVQTDYLGAFIISEGITTIANNAFRGCSGITEITIPNSVTSIGSAAFRECSGLTSVTIPNGVTSIGEYAFCGCSGLASISIPNGVTSIGAYAFYGCSGLTSVTLPDGVTSIGADAFRDCYSLTSVSIPNNVTSIGEDAFYGCASLTSISIPNNVTSIGEAAFYNCYGATSVSIGLNVTSIGVQAFFGCSGLTSISIPNSVTSIGVAAFSGCSQATSISVQAGNPKYHSAGSCIIDTTNKELIFGCKNSVIPMDGSVTSIGERAFCCSDLTSVSIPNSVTNIGKEAFYACSGLTSVTIPNSVTSIGEQAFRECAGLTSVTIGNSVTNIGRYAFESCIKLVSVTILAEVTDIGYAAFNDCSRLTEIHYAGDIAGWCALSGVSNLIGYGLFDDSTSLYIGGSKVAGDLVIPDGVTNIGGYTFYKCKGLTSVTIPNSVTSIGSCAFYGCTGFSSITFQGTTEQWNAISKDNAFDRYTIYTVHCTNGTVSKFYY